MNGCRDRVGDDFGDEDGVVRLDGLKTVDGLVDGDVLLRVGGLGVLPAHEVGLVAVVPGCTASFGSGRQARLRRPPDRPHRSAGRRSAPARAA